MTCPSTNSFYRLFPLPCSPLQLGPPIVRAATCVAARDPLTGEGHCIWRTRRPMSSLGCSCTGHPGRLRGAFLSESCADDRIHNDLALRTVGRSAKGLCRSPVIRRPCESANVLASRMGCFQRCPAKKSPSSHSRSRICKVLEQLRIPHASGFNLT